MKKQVTLSIVLAVTILSFIATVVHSHDFKSSDVQESNLVINVTTYDNVPLEDDNKHKISWAIFTVLTIFLFFKIISTTNYFNHFIRKLLFYTPIFYQSNYVIKAL